MNKKLISAALVLIPNRLQDKAIVRALNFLFKDNPLFDQEGLCISLQISDLKKRWLVKTHSDGFVVVEGRKPKQLDVQLTTTLETLLSARRKEHLAHSIEHQEIEIQASDARRDQVLSSINKLSQAQLNDLIVHCCHFLRISPPKPDLQALLTSRELAPSEVNFLRDEAMRIEQSNLPLALQLMERAHQARPHGPVIKQKLMEYRYRIKSTSAEDNKELLETL